MNWKKITWFVFLILVVLFILIYGVFKKDFEVENLREALKSFGIWSPLIFIGIYTFVTIFVPSTPFMAVAGFLFGFKYGLFYTTIGGILSSIIVFIFARKIGRESTEKILKNKYTKYIAKYDKRLKNGGMIDLIVLRILPIMPFNVLNILMGISQISLKNYIIGTLIGLAPSNILAVYAGNILVKLF